jgi:hypothetical protein
MFLFPVKVLTGLDRPGRQHDQADADRRGKHSRQQREPGKMSRNHPSNEQNHRQGYPSQPPGELAIHCSHDRLATQPGAPQ